MPDDLIGKLRPDTLTPQSARSMIPQLIAVWNGVDHIVLEVRDGKTLTGARLEGLLSWTTPMGPEGLDLSRVIVAIVDVTEIRRAQEDLEALVTSRDELIATVSHELRTPLTTVVGLSHELRDSFGRFDRNRGDRSRQPHRPAKQRGRGHRRRPTRRGPSSRRVTRRVGDDHRPLRRGEVDANGARPRPRRRPHQGGPGVAGRRGHPVPSAKYCETSSSTRSATAAKRSASWSPAADPPAPLRYETAARRCPRRRSRRSSPATTEPTRPRALRPPSVSDWPCPENWLGCWVAASRTTTTAKLCSRFDFLRRTGRRWRLPRGPSLTSDSTGPANRD